MAADARLGGLTGRALGLLDRAPAGRRVLIGIAGAPGAGKTTLTGALAAALTARGAVVAQVPMDGFHLADAALDLIGLRDRKGAPETFDAAGYAALHPAGRAGLWAAILAASIGPNLVITGSVATLIGRRIARQAGATLSAWPFTTIGSALIPAQFAAATLGLHLTGALR